MCVRAIQMDSRLWLFCCLTLGSFLVQSAHLPLVEKPLHMMAAECTTLLHQCGEELNLSGPSLTMVGMVAVSEPAFPPSPAPASGLFASESPMKASTVASAASSTIDPEQMEPVCGSDGRTYSSRCELQRARCEGHPVRVKHRGTCHGEEKRCWSERRVAVKTAKRYQEQQGLRSGPSRSSSSNNSSSSSSSNVGVAGQQTFIPECAEDGRFAEVQCHLGTGYCWCVTPDGKPIPGFSSRHKKPDCKRKNSPNRRSPTKAKHPRKGCSPSDRASFNANLLRIFTTEHNRSPTPAARPDHSAPDSLLDTQDRRIITWKFDQLDLNSDGQLNRNEFKVLRRIVRKLVRPRRCTKNFPRYCDTDQDRKISESEWFSCLGIDINKDSREEADHLVNLRPETDSVVWSKHVVNLQELPSPKEDADQNETNDCASDRQQALDNINHGSQGMYVPECTPDNKYLKVQCHSAGYCWCAHEDTGKPIPSTSVHNAKPNCDNLPTVTQRPVQPQKTEEHRPYVPLTAEEACGKRRSRLQSELLDHFYENMSPKNSSSSRASGSGAARGRWNASLKERVANWQFAQLDTNKNNVMDRHELRALRNLVKRSSKLRKCSKKLPAFCDSNGDRKISPDEWSLCLGLVKGVPLVSPIAGLSSGKRRGPNPLSTYLKE